MIAEDLNNVRAISASASPIDPRPKGLYVSASGSITIGNDDATSATIAVVAGSLLRGLRPFKVTAISGGAVVFACD